MIDPNAKSLKLCETCGRTPILTRACATCLRTLLDEAIEQRDQAEYSAAERIQQLKNERSWQRWWFASLIVATVVLGCVLVRVIR